MLLFINIITFSVLLTSTYSFTMSTQSDFTDGTSNIHAETNVTVSPTVDLDGITKGKAKPKWLGIIINNASDSNDIFNDNTVINIVDTGVITRTCIMDHFRVMDNFNPLKFVGKWYEIKWILEPWIPEEWNYRDFLQTFTADGNNFAIYSLGRPAKVSESCDEGTAALYGTTKTAKYIYDRKYNSTVRMNSTYWIIDTDYVNYGLTYGCRELSVNRTCVQPDCWMWTRTPKPDKKYMDIMENLLADLCLNTSMFITTHHDRECTKASSEGKSNGFHGKPMR